jgi:hypothetical protein
MYTKSWTLLPLLGVLLVAAEPGWKTKDPTQWTKADAQAILDNSPWSQKGEITLLPQRSEAQMRDAGKMGGANGAGFGSLNPSILTGFGGGNRLVKKPAARQTLPIRWESASLIRNAEIKTADERAPAWEGDYYAIAVYDVPGLEDQKTLPVELKKSAYLRLRGEKDWKPAHVDLLFDDKVATVVFLFPRTRAITQKDGHIWFAAQFGHVFVEQMFDVGQMQYQGKVDL